MDKKQAKDEPKTTCTKKHLFECITGARDSLNSPPVDESDTMDWQWIQGYNAALDKMEQIVRYAA